MGIRVYIRNAADEKSENEICLGKLYAYAAPDTYFVSVGYLVKHRCFTESYYEDFDIWFEDHENVVDNCEYLAMAHYIEYEDFAILDWFDTLCFVHLFAHDWEMFWRDDYPDRRYNIKAILDRIEELDKNITAQLGKYDKERDIMNPQVPYHGRDSPIFQTFGKPESKP